MWSFCSYKQCSNIWIVAPDMQAEWQIEKIQWLFTCYAVRMLSKIGVKIMLPQAVLDVSVIGA